MTGASPRPALHCAVTSSSNLGIATSALIDRLHYHPIIVDAAAGKAWFDGCHIAGRKCETAADGPWRRR
jgi:hypothetical protein